MSEIWDSLDNATLGALVGAAGAFLLVVLTDWRRNRRVANVLLPALLRRLQRLVETRDEGVVAALKSLSGGGPWLRNIGLRFPTARIESLGESVADRVSERQLSALDNLTFHMRAADELNAESAHLLGRLEETRGVPAFEIEEEFSRGALAVKLKGRYGEERVLLRQIRLTLDAYLSDELTDSGGPLSDPRLDAPEEPDDGGSL